MHQGREYVSAYDVRAYRRNISFCIGGATDDKTGTHLVCFRVRRSTLKYHHQTFHRFIRNSECPEIMV